MKLEAEGVDAEGNQDETDSACDPMFEVGHLKESVDQSESQPADLETYLGHSQITKLLPKILDCVQSNEGSREKSNPFDTWGKGQ